MFTPPSESAEPASDVLTLSPQLQLASVAKSPVIYLIAGARPNFMKIAPLVRALQADGRLRWKIVHTGQHYDHDMNEVFFEELGIPAPDVQLSAGRGTHAEQTSRIILAFEKLCIRDRPDCVLVVGDVNSTLACSIVAKKLNIRVAHVEAGLRSGDMSMPEEINRLVTDSISDWFFVTEPSGMAHLSREGKPSDRVHEVGHVMVDNLLYQAAKLEQMDPEALETSALKRRHPRYGVVTLHRPSNVDDPVVFKRLVSALNTVSQTLPLLFPIHPRTQNNIARFEIQVGDRVELMKPQAYMAFLNLWKDAAVVLTDSGGLQEETTALGVPCVTLRENTERPITVDEGTNMLAGTDPERVVELALLAAAGGGKRGRRPHLWDGHAAARIVGILARELLPK
jgi:UDP-N-acetylglucosamine 2-epimerase (non-hydrolysing)